MELRKTTQTLSCILTTEEKLTSATEIGSESQLYQEALDRKKEVTKQLSADVESRRASIQRLGTLLANGYEYRPVKCEMKIDRENDSVIVTRMDTGEVIENRTLRPEELQDVLPLD